jgi:uncharacterized membrane protein
MEYRLPRLVSVGIVVVTFLASALAYSSLPATMATHWGLGGQVDGTMPKLYGAFIVPILLLGVGGLLYVIPRIDPRRENIEAFRGLYEWFIAGFLLFLAYVHGLVLVWNLGIHVPIGRALAPALAGLFIGIGYLLEYAEPNWFIGIRTPWTLSDDEVWSRTHERGALAFKLAGVLALGGVVFPSLSLLFILIPVLGAAVYTVGYSFVLYRRRHESH